MWLANNFNESYHDHIAAPPPLAGGLTDTILSALGYSSAEITELRELCDLKSWPQKKI